MTGICFKEFTMEENNLKPCPFCGGTDIGLSREQTDTGWSYYEYCSECCACGPEAVTEKTAEMLWNLGNKNNG